MERNLQTFSYNLQSEGCAMVASPFGVGREEAL